MLNHYFSKLFQIFTITRRRKVLSGVVVLISLAGLFFWTQKPSPQKQSVNPTPVSTPFRRLQALGITPLLNPTALPTPSSDSTPTTTPGTAVKGVQVERTFTDFAQKETPSPSVSSQAISTIIPAVYNTQPTFSQVSPTLGFTSPTNTPIPEDAQNPTNEPTERQSPPTNIPNPTTPIQPTFTPTPTPGIPTSTSTITPKPPTPTPETLDEGTKAVLSDVFIKMCMLERDINLYKKWREEALQRQADCRPRLTEVYKGLSPFELEKKIQECREAEQKYIDEYEWKITELGRERNAYARQKNEMLVGCPLCVEFWNAFNQTVLKDPERYGCGPQ